MLVGRTCSGVSIHEYDKIWDGAGVSDRHVFLDQVNLRSSESEHLLSCPLTSKCILVSLLLDCQCEYPVAAGFEFETPPALISSAAEPDPRE